MDKKIDRRQKPKILPFLTTDSIQTRHLSNQISEHCGHQCSLFPPSAGIDVALYALNPDVILLDLVTAESSEPIGEILRRLTDNGVMTLLLNASADLKGVKADRMAALDVSADVEDICQEIAPWLPEPTQTPQVSKVTLREPLTSAELRVLRQLQHGQTNDQIAEQLCLSAHTVKSHLYSIYQKLGVKNRSAAALWASRSLAT